MRLVYDDQALADLEDIFNWIAQDNPATAKTVVDRLFSSTSC
jgi:toxin ParE1/3/4